MASNTAFSSSTTLFPASADLGVGSLMDDEIEKDDWRRNSFSSMDHPVQIPQFRSNVRWCRGGMALSAVSRLALSISALLGSPQGTQIDGLAIWQLALLSLIVLVLLISARHEAPIRIGPNAARARFSHRNLASTLFVLSCFSFCLTCASTYESIDIFLYLNDRIIPNHAIRCSLQFILSLATLLSSGLMRRGPRLWYHAPGTELGFGVPASGEKDKRSTEEILNDAKGDPVPNVMDYGEKSCLSFLLFGYLSPLFIIARSGRPLDELDVPYQPQTHRSFAVLGDAPNQRWRAYNRGGVGATMGDGPSTGNGTSPNNQPYTRWTLMRTCWDGLWWGVLYSGFLEVVSRMLRIAPAICLQQFVIQFETGAIREDGGQKYSLLLAILFAGSTTVRSVLEAYLTVRENYQQHQPARVRAEFLCFEKIFQKADSTLTLKRAEEDRGDQSGAQKELLRLITTDAGDIASLSAHVFFPFTNNIALLAISLWFIINTIGWSAAGLLIQLATIPFLRWVAKWTYRQNLQFSAAQDKRIKAIRSALSCLKVLKLNAWDRYFESRIFQLRQVELRTRYRADLGYVAAGLALFLPSQLSLVAIFAIETVVRKRTLTAATAFGIMSMFNLVREAIDEIPQSVNRSLSAWLSLQRVAHFLNSGILEIRPMISRDIKFVQASIAFPVEDASFPALEDRFMLRDLNFNIRPGSLTLITGAVASGKTLLILSILGEAHISLGFICAPRSSKDVIPLPQRAWHSRNPTEMQQQNWIIPTATAYAPQVPCIIHGSIRSNICQGLPFWPERFQETLSACALDMKDFPDADQTEIGEGGHNISGGQKMRISLARAVYSRAETLLLDDVLSAVDADTARRIVQDCFGGPLVRDRTVIVATHQPQICQTMADAVLEVANGTVMVKESSQKSTFARNRPTDDLAIPVYEAAMLRAKGLRDSTAQVNAAEDIAAPLQLIEAESRKIGIASHSHLWRVLRAAGGPAYFTVLGSLFWFRSLETSGMHYWLRIWTGHESLPLLGMDGPLSEQSYLTIFAALLLLDAVSESPRTVVMVYRFVLRAGSIIHNDLVRAVFRAPLLVQERLPAGRLLNRFIDDINRINTLHWQLATITKGAISTSVVVAIVAWTTPAFLIVAVIIIPAMIPIYRIMTAMRSDTRRVASIAGSPVITIYNDVVNGACVLRAYGAQVAYTARMMRFQDSYRRLGITEYMVWNAFRLALTSASSIIFGFTAILLVFQPNLSGAAVGLALSFATNGARYVTDMLSELVEAGTSLVAVERVDEYCSIPPEEDPNQVTIDPQSPWPSKGHILIDQLCVTYSPSLPDVLHSISAEILPGQRIACVGHTGHGKSTLALSLFRAVKARSGKIWIDGVDIETVGLFNLRSGLSAIPQEALLNDGTLRDALDIGHEKTDLELYDSLRQVQLLPSSTSATSSSAPSDTNASSNRFLNLDTPVESGGSNFSVGERQLLCMARALLKPRAVMVFDEATSSISLDVDKKIRDTIRNSFKGSTMLVIAHRLASIMDFDKVMVLEHGTLVEFDSPRNLMDRKDSAFSALVRASGEKELVAMLSSGDGSEEQAQDAQIV